MLKFVRITSFSLSVETGEPGIRQMLAVGLEDARVEVKDNHVLCMNNMLAPQNFFIVSDLYPIL